MKAYYLLETSRRSRTCQRLPGVIFLGELKGKFLSNGKPLKVHYILENSSGKPFIYQKLLERLLPVGDLQQLYLLQDILLSIRGGRRFSICKRTQNPLSIAVHQKISSLGRPLESLLSERHIKRVITYQETPKTSFDRCPILGNDFHQALISRTDSHDSHLFLAS